MIVVSMTVVYELIRSFFERVIFSRWGGWKERSHNLLQRWTDPQDNIKMLYKHKMGECRLDSSSSQQGPETCSDEHENEQPHLI